MNDQNNIDNGNQWRAVVADNGFMYTNSVALISKALESWVNTSVMPMPNRDIAANYAVTAYVNRFLGRNYSYGFVPRLPINLPPNVTFEDVEYEAREGNREKMLPFPGLPF